jgi:hypothetical protein
MQKCRINISRRLIFTFLKFYHFVVHLLLSAAAAAVSPLQPTEHTNEQTSVDRSILQVIVYNQPLSLSFSGHK